MPRPSPSRRNGRGRLRDFCSLVALVKGSSDPSGGCVSDVGAGTENGQMGDRYDAEQNRRDFAGWRFPMKPLAEMAVDVLQTADGREKTQMARACARQWLKARDMGKTPPIGQAVPPDFPARPDTPELLPPRDVPRRRHTFIMRRLIRHITPGQIAASFCACDHCRSPVLV